MTSSKKSERRTLFLVDGTSQLFRAYFALPGLTNDEGMPTNAVFGFTTMLRKLIRDESASYLAVAFDVKGPVFRHETYAEYKANRPPTPEDLKIQAPYAKQVCEVLGARVLELPGYEADDLIATYARMGREEGFDVVIVASDKDLLQLVGPGIKVFNPSKNLYLDEEGVESSFGVPPERVLDVQALMGDSVDNIPGVPGVGAKTAVAIVQAHGGLEEVISRAGRFVAALEARDRFLESWVALEKSREIESAAAQEVAELGRSFVERLSTLVDADPVSELRDRYAALVEAFRGFDWNGLAAAEGSGKAATAELKPLKKEVKGLERGSAKKAWTQIHEHAEQARLSRTLATLHDGVPVDHEPEGLRREEIDTARALAFFTSLGFTAMIEEFGAEAAAEPPAEPAPAIEPASEEELPAPSAEQSFELVTDKKSLDRLIHEIGKAGNTAVRAEADAVAFSVAENHGRVVRLSGKGAPRGVKKALAPLLADPEIRKQAHDLKQQDHRLREAGLPVEGWGLDTRVAAFMLHPGRSGYGVTALAQEFLGESETAAEPARASTGQMSLALEPDEDPEAVLLDSAREAERIHRLARALEPRLDEAGLRKLYDEVDGPLLPLLGRMERHGIRIDTDLLGRMSAEMQNKLDELRGLIHELAGKEFNVDSPKQLREVLFEEMGLKPGRKTAKSKVASTDAQTLEELAAEHEIASRLLEYRELAKLQGTYVDALPRLVDPRTERVHTRYDPTGAATGRLSSSDPNLQNIPVRSEAGRKIRAAFVPDDGFVFLASDYSQVELRVLAHMCDDEGLIAAFDAGEDIHRYTASKVSGLPIDEVTTTMRRRAKAVNFGILYGMSEIRLAREQGISRGEAREFIQTYFERFANVRGYIDGVREQVLRDAAVRTLFGRVRYFPQLHQRVHRGVQEQAYRAAVNTTIQGTAADLMKMAMLAVEAALIAARSEARMLLQVHDELLLEVPRDELAPAQKLVRGAMEGVYRLKVPLAVDQKSGESWLDVT